MSSIPILQLGAPMHTTAVLYTCSGWRTLCAGNVQYIQAPTLSDTISLHENSSCPSFAAVSPAQPFTTAGAGHGLDHACMEPPGLTICAHASS